MSKENGSKTEWSKRPIFPFTAIVGQEGMKLALILNVVDPSIGGVLMMGHRGTGKSTAVRALADLLPEIWVTRDCPFNCDPANPKEVCADCESKLVANNKLPRERSAVPVVDLPLGATEDRVCGSIDIQRALKDGVKAFEPGLLARANRGFIYIDEVNLLEDHLVDLLLDVAITGRNQVERENISVEHPARFVLIGSGNPEEGELRPQLLDRFGLYVEVTTENDTDRRVDIVEQREAFERNPEKFCATREAEQKQLRLRIARAVKSFPGVKVDRSLLRQIAKLCSELKVDGHRGEITIMRAARALAAFEGRKVTTETDVRQVAMMALRHRLHRDPLGEPGSGKQIEQALDKAFPESEPSRGSGNRSSSPDQNGDRGVQGPRSSGGRGASTAANRDVKPQAQDGAGSGTETNALPAMDAQLPELMLTTRASVRTATKATTRDRQGGLRRTSHSYDRGRYTRTVSLKQTGARIAVLATLRAAILSGQDLTASDLRYQQFARKNGTLFIFAIDASGSMALNRINQAKGALLRLLAQSYVNRDSVAIVSFKGTDAEVLLPPSRSVVRARRGLETLTIGGGTPLSAGLVCSLEVARRARAHGNGEIVLLLFTDGHANVPVSEDVGSDRNSRQQMIKKELRQIGNELAESAVEVVVVDTSKGFTGGGQTHELTELLGAKYLTLNEG